MLILEVELENIKSYVRAVVPFAEGVNAICGPNGAGKTTILEAIGYALFNYLPYKQEDFLRDGEKSGSIRVAVVSSLDERRYTVVRRIGRTAAYFVYDPDANLRHAEGSEDVQRWLREHLALDEAADLRGLFLDTVGVPQGTLTAIFLESAGVRRPKFDKLLRVEEYEEAFKKLLETKNHLKDRLGALKSEVAGLEARAAVAPELEAQLAELATRKAALASQLAARLADEERARRRLQELEHVRDELQRLRSAQESQRRELESLGRQLDAARAQLARAEEARATVEASAAGYRAYLEAATRLRELEQRRQERDRLHADLAEVEKRLAALEADRMAARKRVSERLEAERRLAHLAPAAGRQEELEAELRQAQADAQSLAELQREIEQRRARAVALGRDVEEQRNEIQRLEALRSSAADLSALVEEGNGLLTQIGALQKQQTQLAQAQSLRETAERKQRQARDELGRALAVIAQIEPLREKAARAEGAEVLLRDAESRAAELRAALAQIARDRQQVQGGACPFLGEACRNLRPGVTLELVLDERAAKLSAQLRERDGRLDALRAALDEARQARQQVARLDDLYRQRDALERATAEADRALAEALATLDEMAALPELMAARKARQRELSERIRAAQDADRKVSAIPAKESHLASLRDALRGEEERLAPLGERQVALRDAPQRAAAVRRQLEGLGDARTAFRMATEQAAGRGQAEAELAGLDQAVEVQSTARTEIRGHLESFASLDDDLAAQSGIQQSSEGPYQSYLRNVDLAQTVERLKEAAGDVERQAAEAQRALSELSEHVESGEASFDAAALGQAQEQVTRLTAELGETRAHIHNCEDQEAEKAAELEIVRRLQRELEEARARAREVTALEETLEVLRKAIKDAGPHVTQILLESISDQATSINAEIMGTHTAELEWAPDYEIIMRQRGLERSFRQLSGGEQMSAALAVRLALLRELSGINVAFFDEPTQNMDQERRGNLAEQIPNLGGFAQLFVITHDDSFETSIDHVVHIDKQDGCSRVIDDA